MKQLLFLVFLFFLSCNQKIIKITQTSKEEGRKSVQLFQEIFPDSIKINKIKYPVSKYYTVYSVYFPLINHPNYWKTNPIEFEEYFPDIKLKKVEKKFQKLKKIDSNFSGFRIYHGLDSTQNFNRTVINPSKSTRMFKSENFLVFVKIDPTNNELIKEDLCQVYKINNHIFDLRGFTEIRPEYESRNYHLSCAPNCPKPDLISEN